ncbi:MAG: hypothetical protein L3J74_08840 [Bacteroidales bacterium]|nr:hypothetical protein [Bacteroidales bacterium]
MHIFELIDKYYHIKITLNTENTVIKYNPAIKDLQINNQSNLDKLLNKNRYQLQKILNNKRPDTFYIDFRLKFILRDNFKAVNFNDLSNIVVLDRRNNQYLTYTHSNKEKKIFRIYTDGCYLAKLNRAACVYISKNIKNKLNIYTENLFAANSSLTELVAVIRALQHHKNIQELRIVTDSRYIIKGLTEWIFNWKLNDWHTAQGEKVKNINYWKQFEELSRNDTLSLNG